MALRNLICLLFGLSWLILSGSEIAAQEKQGANWLFGEKIHVDFNGNSPAVDTFSFTAVDTLYNGVATISDKNGQLLFFSSGGIIATRLKVNGVYQAMPNGNFFTGVQPKYTTAEMIVQSPADSNIYYLIFVGFQFRNNTPYQDLYRLQIDMRLNNGFGDVVPNSLQLLRKQVSYYRLTAMLHANNRDTWAVTTNQTGDSIIAYLLTPNGIMPPVKTKAANPFTSSSRMKASPNSEMFAAFERLSSNEDALAIYNFNRASGVAGYQYSLVSPLFDYPFFSCAFSPDNSKLYAGNGGYYGFPKNANVFQYDLNAGSALQVQQSRNVIYNTTASYTIADMQLGIDGKIYLIKNNDAYLSQISCPDLYGSACNYKSNTISLPVEIKGGTLPTLNQTIFRNAGKLQAQATRNVICEGDTVQLSAYGAGAEKFKWEAANGLSASSETLANPLVNPTVTTTYKVTGSSVCNASTAFVTVTVLPKIPDVTVMGPLQVATFTEQEYFVKAPQSGSIFNWQVSGGTIVSGQGQSHISVNWGTAGEGIVSVFEDPQTGCNGEKVSLKVQITEGPEPVIYNIITPDSDGKNDTFVIENLKWYPENTLKIYNRWGVEVYKSMNYQNNWKAENVSAGVYYYFFKAKGRSWKGWVEVVK